MKIPDWYNSDNFWGVALFAMIFNPDATDRDIPARYFTALILLGVYSFLVLWVVDKITR